MPVPSLIVALHICFQGIPPVALSIFWGTQAPVFINESASAIRLYAGSFSIILIHAFCFILKAS